MFIRFGFEIALESPKPTPLILALSPHPTHSGQTIGSAIQVDPDVTLTEFIDPFGNRRTRLVAPSGHLRLWTDCIIEDDGLPDVFNWNARQHEIADLPPDTVPFLTASRYCESDALVDRAWALFGNTAPGWARVQAICDFVHNHLTFGYKFGRPTKTAGEALREGTGVCRDFAHLAVAFCRAMNIPARYASGYLGEIGVPPAGPGDFSAWFEAYLEGAWHTFDARHNMPRIGRILMVHGRDAADSAIVTSFGSYDLKLFRVWTDELPEGISSDTMLSLLQQLPDAPALTLAPTGTA